MFISDLPVPMGQKVAKGNYENEDEFSLLSRGLLGRGRASYLQAFPKAAGRLSEKLVGWLREALAKFIKVLSLESSAEIAVATSLLSSKKTLAFRILELAHTTGSGLITCFCNSSERKIRKEYCSVVFVPMTETE